MSLLTGQPRSATVIAEEETEVLQIKKRALKPIFETNPSLVADVCKIIEQRRELLKSNDKITEETDEENRKGVFGSIKKFFGLDE